MRPGTLGLAITAATVLMVFNLAVPSTSGEPLGDRFEENLSSAELSGVSYDMAQLYVQYCGGCHGMRLRGSNRGPSLLHRLYQPDHLADTGIEIAIKEGVTAHHWKFGDMKPVETINHDPIYINDLEQIHTVGRHRNSDSDKP